MPSRPVPNQLEIVIRPPGRAPYVLGLNTLTAHVRAYRTLRMGRLRAKIDQARNAKLALETAIERDMDALIARTAEVDKKRQDVVLRQHMDFDSHVTDLGELDRDLDLLKNDVPSDGSAYHGTGGKNT